MLFEPSGDIDWTLSDIAVEWAAEVGGYALDPWQSWLVRWTFARSASDRLWMARDIGAEVTRQSGKNIWLEVVELVGALEFGDDLQTHSAHRADTSHEHFVSLRTRIQTNDDLMALMPRRHNNGFVTTNGNESIEFANGHRILFKSRNQGSGRGPRPKRLIFDEALVLNHDQVGNMAPGISAQRNPQIIFASSAPKADSEVLHSLRARARDADEADRFFYAAWNNDAGVDVDNPDAWYRVNPSLGFGRMTEKSLNANRKLMAPAEFAREHLGIPEEPIGTAGGPIAVEVWQSLTDGDSLPLDGTERLSLEVSPDRAFSTFGIAGRRADNLGHVSIRHREPGTSWVVGRAKELTDGHGCPLTIVSGSPAAGFIPDLELAGVPVDVMSPAEFAGACQRFVDAVNATEPLLRHRGSPDHTAAVAAAQIKPAGDGGFVLSRRSSSSDITPLTSAVIAWARVGHGAVAAAPGFSNLADYLEE